MGGKRIRILPTITIATAFMFSGSLSSCRKAPGPNVVQSQEGVNTPSLLSSDEPATERLTANATSPEQPPPQTPATNAPVYPSTLVDLTPDSKSEAPAQAKKLRVTRRPDGTELERTYLDERGQEIRTIRNSEDGVVEISRTFDASGQIARERTTLNGVDQSALRKAQ